MVLEAGRRGSCVGAGRLCGIHEEGNIMHKLIIAGNEGMGERTLCRLRLPWDRGPRQDWVLHLHQGLQ